MIALLAAVVIAQASPAPSPSPSASSSPPAPVVATKFPAPLYSPIPCRVLVTRAKVGGQAITAERLGRVFAEALKAHNVKAGSSFDPAAVAKAEADFNSCFQAR